MITALCAPTAPPRVRSLSRCYAGQGSETDTHSWPSGSTGDRFQVPPRKPRLKNAQVPSINGRAQRTLKHCGVRSTGSTPLPPAAAAMQSEIEFNFRLPSRLTTNSLLLTGSLTSNINSLLTHIVYTMHCILRIK